MPGFWLSHIYLDICVVGDFLFGILLSSRRVGGWAVGASTSTVGMRKRKDAKINQSISSRVYLVPSLLAGDRSSSLRRIEELRIHVEIRYLFCVISSVYSVLSEKLSLCYVKISFCVI